MKLLVSSDFHGRELPAASISRIAMEENCDAIIVCGDLADGPFIPIASRILTYLTEFNIPVFYVPGNMDSPSLTSNINVPNTKCLHGVHTTFNNLVFAGIGGAIVGPFNTPFELSEEEFKSLLEKAFLTLSNNVVLITHCPPRNTAIDKTRFGTHIGSIELRRIIETKQPIASFSGHVHEARGIDKINKTVIVNPGPAFKGYYSIVEVKDREVKVDLRKI
ncbi:MAG: metallophosphoesterase family protein [Candidatus Methanomethylicia archaeon]